ncbi:MAG: DUF6578 domain-containing protein [Streptosporangiaceae bacterium]
MRARRPPGSDRGPCPRPGRSSCALPQPDVLVQPGAGSGQAARRWAQQTAARTPVDSGAERGFRWRKVTWTLRDADPDWFAAMLGPFVRRTVEMEEEHHGGVPEDTPPTTGTVTLIAAVHCRYAPRAAMQGPATPSRVPASLQRSSRRMGGHQRKR